MNSEIKLRLKKYNYAIKNIINITIKEKKMGEGLTAIAYKCRIKNLKCIAIKKKVGIFSDEEINIYKITTNFVLNKLSENFVLFYGLYNDYIILERGYSNLDTVTTKLNNRQQIELYIKIFTTLKLLHDNKILHNDVTFSNILFLKNSIIPLLTDYDRSKLITNRELTKEEISYDTKRVISHTLVAILKYKQIKIKPPMILYYKLKDINSPLEAINKLKNLGKN